MGLENLLFGVAFVLGALGMILVVAGALLVAVDGLTEGSVFGAEVPDRRTAN
jgi:hypothetical protein